MEYFKTYLKTLELSGDYSENTVQAYSSDLKRFFHFLENNFARDPVVGDLNSGTIKEFLESEKRSGFSASTLHRRKVALSKFLHYLRKTGNISSRDVHVVLDWRQSLWKEIYNRDVETLSDFDLHRLFSVLKKETSAKAIRDRSIISILLDTGLTTGKIISINLHDLDLDQSILKVMINGIPKNISINESTIFLGDYVNIGRKEFTQSLSEEALFVSQMGARISRQGVWQLVKEWGEKANLYKPLSPRILRNTKIMKLVAAGLTTAELQQQLGHINRYSTRALVRKIKKIT